ncbi:ABC transporter ATP-binding protein [Pseudodonghicola flavimaris]|uniref:ABC transporter ATP-binding protein n=1 Tax=Pseudodonghicola flavimaris TaxID=3050036 RepID=A0ABT7F3C1_9RHOB|nr:ABC transporter ATP-binding protein [Pseudodonghicola flavimaris]MDK3019113.1 ABC transporter ATP-binding protein [Pseudodonghicola flavimaris]
MTDPVLSVRDLRVRFRSGGRETQVVHGVDFDIRGGETLALVGESGSGKSVTSFALMRLLPEAPRCRISGSVRIGGVELLELSERRMAAIRGPRIAMIFQEPLTSLNPVHRVGDQIAEAIRFHRRMSRSAIRARVIELLSMVGIPDPARRMHAYPGEMSGGMRQRVVIAMALALEPDLLIADEPTTALDVTVQAQILELLKDIQRRTNMAMLFITHDFGVVAEIADRVMVMYAGRIVEGGELAEVLSSPRMPYTRGLLGSVPRFEDAGLRSGPLGTIEGFVPSPDALPQGCAFHPRCPHARPGLCDVDLPDLTAVDGTGHRVRCLRASEPLATENTEVPA